jgi:radical SAM/Cys-rich protein
MSEFYSNRKILKNKFNVIQINIGDLCNLSCTHCHVAASPKGSKNMDEQTASSIIDKILSMDIKTVEFTGGTPEMNPNFLTFLEKLSTKDINLVVRTSLTVLEDKEYAHFLDVYKKYQVKVVASLPSMIEESTAQQRGKGVYSSTITLLQKLNELGYGNDTDSELRLDLVYNPVGTFLPAPQSKLELEYKTILKDKFNVTFNSLATIVNMPIKRFKFDLTKHKLLDEYMTTLKSKYNEKTIDNIMCRNVLSINYAGNVFDCDFNLSLEMPIKGYETTKFWDIDFDNFEPEISFDLHCYACTVNSGSSCTGEVIKEACSDKVQQVACNV